MIDWTLEPIFGSYWIAGGLVIAMLASWFLLREDREVTRGKRIVLGFMRFVVILLIAIGIFRPGATYTRQSAPRGAVAVMVDLSQSMELPSGVDRKTRWQIEVELWNKLIQAQASLGKESPLVIYGYDDKLKLIQGDSNNQVKILPQGSFSDVGKTLSELIATQVEPPLNAVIWMGDATQTVIPSTVDPQVIARQLTQLDIPLILFGLGPRGDVDRLQDVSIEGVPEQITVFSSTESQVMGLLSTKSMVNRDLKVQLFMKMEGQPPKMLAEENLRPDKADQTLPFRLPFTAPEAGSYELEVVVPPQKEELSQENNRALCFLNVNKGGSRVLYLEGEPRWEQRYLRRSLESSPDFQLRFQWVHRKEWKKDLTPQLKSGEYDAYILGDLDAAALTPETWKMLADRVQEGAGLITLGGYQAYGPGGHGETPLRDILPVEMDSRFRQVPGSPIQPTFHYPAEMEIPMRPVGELNGAGAIAQLAPGPDNMKTWIKLPGMKGASKWSGIKNAPGVRVVLEGTKREPMVVAGGAKNGRVLSMAFDTSHVWWQQGFSEQHKKFWRQSVLWVIRRENPEEGIELEMDRRRLFRDQTSELSLRWNPGATNNPIPKETNAKLFRDGNEVGLLNLSGKDERTLTGKISNIQTPGRYEIRATSINSQGQPLQAKLPFVVLEQSVESMHPTPDWPLMNQMAQLNASAGGCLLAPEELDQAIEKLNERRKTSTIDLVESYKVGDGSIDSWALFAMLVGLLSLQWRLRKQWSLA